MQLAGQTFDLIAILITEHSIEFIAAIDQVDTAPTTQAHRFACRYPRSLKTQCADLQPVHEQLDGMLRIMFDRNLEAGNRRPVAILRPDPAHARRQAVKQCRVVV